MNVTSKAQTLKHLEGKVQHAVVLPQFCFSVNDWVNDKASVLQRFSSKIEWSNNTLIVRSSSCLEDSLSTSLAGQFTSILNVNGNSELEGAVDSVVASFHEVTDDDHVFIQPMLENVALSGVVFTSEPSTNAPYYVINYSESADTEVVTSGKGNTSVIYISREKHDINNFEPWVGELLKLCEELLLELSFDAIDVEFAVDNNGLLYLFQSRPLVINDIRDVAHEKHAEILKRIETTVSRILKPHPYLNGKRSVLGVMPDWNPAEIIGIRPKPLALSLYKELVTDSIWAYQRDNYGYKQLRSFPLLVSLCGLPYIDVRVSFNSFIPSDIDSHLAEKLVNYYIHQLELRPEKHDKVEFDIIFSCFTLDLPKRLEKLKESGFSNDELDTLAESLRTLTNNIISPDGLWSKDIRKIEKLPERREHILSSGLSNVEKVVWLLEDCKRYGTLPFAGLARAGFIAVQILKSLVNEGILSQQDCDNYLRSLNTVSSSITIDRRQMTPDEFLSKYGHLRPGTYDITSPRYDQDPDRYFEFSCDSRGEACYEDNAPFLLSLEQLDRLKDKLEEFGIEHDVMSLFKFIKGAIEGREYAKFVFSKSLSDALLIIEELGAKLDLTKEDLSFANIQAFYNAYSSADTINELLNYSVEEGKKRYEESSSVILPPLIVSPDDVYQFKMPEGEPNYITLGRIVKNTTSCIDNKRNLEDKIVFIPAADPGYDWIFSANIAGLITQFGGANSHMAIRAGELGIPAVIGAGEVLYKRWMQAELLELDAANRKVNVLK